MALVRRLDHVGVTVRDLEAVLAFFVALGVEPDGDPQVVEGHWLEQVTGLDGARVEVVTVRAPGDGAGLELARYHHPDHEQEPAAAPATALGLRTIAFEVDDLQATLTRVRELGFGLVHAVGNYEDVFELCYVRGPEGIIVMLAQSLG